MSTIQTPAPRERMSGSKVTMTRVFRSEVLKLTTLKSTWIVLAALLVSLLGLGILASYVVRSGGQAGPPGVPIDAVRITLGGADLGVLIIGVLGALVGSREYASGMARLSLAAVPRRWPTLLGKTLAFTLLVLPTLLVSVLAAFLIGSSILEGGGISVPGLGDDGVLRSVLGMAAFLLGVGLLGLAIGVLLRSTAGAIGTVIGAVIVLPPLAMALLPDSWDKVLKLLPSNAANSFASYTPNPTLLSPGAGAIVFVAWVVGLLVVAGVALSRRDV